MGQFYFTVIRFDKNKMILLGLMAVLLIALFVFGLISLTGAFKGAERDYIVLDFDIQVQNEEFDGDLHTLFPRYFVAGGISYDNNVLGNHGIEVASTSEINHFDEIGVYTIKAKINEVRYYERSNRVVMYVQSQESGYNMITFSKGELSEGPITFVFANLQGETISIEEDYIYSTPVSFTVLDQGAKYLASDQLDQFVVVDNEIKPVIASAGYDIEVISEMDNSHMALYVFGGEVLTIQKQGENLRVYFDEGEGYQVLSFDTTKLKEGQNSIKFIREKDLKEIKTLSFWKNK